jgi:hypothetical protein
MYLKLTNLSGQVSGTNDASHGRRYDRFFLLHLAETGLEALLPRPDGGGRVQNYRISPTLSKPPSWVSSFVYVDGRFRFVGGTYPFWNEKLTPLRGPMAIPAKSIGDLAVQGVPVDVDPKTPGVVAGTIAEVTVGCWMNKLVGAP